MFQNNKAIAALYLIAFIGCLLSFFRGHSWGYLVASVLWLMLGIYCLVKKNDDF